MKIDNFFENIPHSLTEEWIQEILNRDTVRVERIVSRGHRSPQGFWYDQSENEWVLLLKGSAGVRLESSDEPVVLGPGDHLLIPAHTRHRVDWTDEQDDTVWVAVFFR